MKTRSDFPYQVREVADLWITLRDSCRLSGRMWLPSDAEARPVPAILVFLPYRTGDSMLPWWSSVLPYLAGFGYAAVSIDARGTDGSDGVLDDEYSDQELADGAEVVGWLAQQPWCAGAVGMWGISWMGCNSLQVAALRPPALKAVISVCSMVDLQEDLYFEGGCLLQGNLEWATVLHALMAQPPRPTQVGERWRTMWLERLEKMSCFIEAKLSHQRRDGYWRRASICENYDAIACPVYMVGGWADGYVNAIPRFLAGYPGPRKALIGPWRHQVPHDGSPGPAIGFLQESIRWWDHWLKGIDTGIMREPMLRVWMQDSVEPRESYDTRPGRWVAEPGWPAASTEPRAYVLNPGELGRVALPETAEDCKSPQHLGLQAGSWMSSPAPSDQREDDALSLCFTSPVLEEPLEILGCPEVKLGVAADRTCAFVAARLCDVAPGGASTLITRGLLNLTRREGLEHPLPLEPGRRYSVSIPLRVIGYRVAAGHRLRLAISPTYWPYAWPSPEAATLIVFTGLASRLMLPVRKPRPEDGELAPFPEPEAVERVSVTWPRSSSHTWTVSREVLTGRYEVAQRSDGGRWRLEGTGLEYGYTGSLTSTIQEGNPLSAQTRCENGIEIAEGDWQTGVEVTSTLTSDLTTFRVAINLDAYEGAVRAFTRSWSLDIPRDLV